MNLKFDIKENLFNSNAGGIRYYLRWRLVSVKTLWFHFPYHDLFPTILNSRKEVFFQGQEYFFQKFATFGLLISTRHVKIKLRIIMKNLQSIQLQSFQKIDFTTYGLQRDQPPLSVLVLFCES